MSSLQKSMFLVATLLFAASGFATDLVLDNQTDYPKHDQNTKIAVQWANSAKEVEDGNQALVAGSKLQSETMIPVTHTGKIKLDAPEKAEYFRVLVWSKGDGEPDLHTNWVEIIPHKTYTLKTDQLIPSVLMSGMGC